MGEIKSVKLDQAGVEARAARERRATSATAEQRAKAIVRERSLQRARVVMRSRSTG